MEVSNVAYQEVKQKLLDADYGHCILSTGEIDLTGIALVAEGN
jgi:hypothetical protein